ncbi:MAG: peptidyl-prolyl cis-trans isomerase [Pyrinomonadaceae bacterium]|nr:peptidyl-prolyl cis-trans isomerase [Pyrinomonadaceae bacterium]MCX7639827.1 peptidyl-prolyl cis-trans isomerase [Pyrinomonadaceae bacterium]MDW8305349.1 peptidyl-prolyl cis-trans isomerase [Acidobacteriota bacterium]
MIKFFSRLEKTRNLIIIVFGIVLVLSMIFFGVSVLELRSTPVNARSTETAAKVGSEYITVGDLVRQKELFSIFGGQAPATSILLDMLIKERILRQEARRFQLTASDAEVADEIKRRNTPEDGRPFDLKQYEQNVIERYGSIKAYEESVRDELSARKLEAFITAGVTVSEEEVIEDFKRRNTKFELRFVSVNVNDLAKTIKPTEEELKDYYEKNKANYYIDQPQKKIRYIFVNTSKIGEKLNISDEELKAEYEKLPEDKKQAGVEGQQIVLRITKPEFETQVLERAENLVKQAREKGEIVSEEDFARLARGFSEDPVTARNGGKLPGIVKRNPNNPSDPYQRLLSMKEGEITEPIKYGERYYILRRGASVPKTFEMAKKELEVSLRNRKAYAAASDLAKKIAEDLAQTKNVEETAKKFLSQANLSLKEMIRETDFVKPGDDVPNIGISPQFEEGIAGLNEPNDTGDPIPIKDGFGIPLLVEKRDPRDATFEEVKEKVTEAVKLEKARSALEQVAKEIAQNSSNLSQLSSVAQSKGLKAEEAKSFILGSPLGSGPTAGTSRELEQAILSLKPGEVTRKPIKVGENWYIVGLVKKEDADMEEFAKQRTILIESALLQKRSAVFADYIASVRQKLESEGKIKIYQEAVNKVDGLQTDIE